MIENPMSNVLGEMPRLLFSWLPLCNDFFGRSAALWLYALLSGSLLVLLFRAVSPQQRLQDNRRLLSAFFLEAVIFRRQSRISLRAQGRAAAAALRHLRLSLAAFVPVLPLALLLMTPLEPFYADRALTSAESAVLTVRTEQPETIETLSLHSNGDVTVDTPVLRIPRTRSAYWRIRRTGPKAAALRLQTADGQMIELPLKMDDRDARHGRMWSQAVFDMLSYGAQPLSSAKIARAEISSPAAEYDFFTLRLSALEVFCLGSLLGGAVSLLLFAGSPSRKNAGCSNGSRRTSKADCSPAAEEIA
jgi:hypothetical protein